MSLTYQDIHTKLKLSGNAQFVSGIRQTIDRRGFVLIAMSSKDYKDRMDTNGTLLYMGHGKNGDQKMWMNNKKLNDAPVNTPLFLFTRVGPNRYKFKGVFKKFAPVYVEKYEGRRVFVFPMKKCTPSIRHVPVVPSVPLTHPTPDHAKTEG